MDAAQLTFWVSLTLFCWRALLALYHDIIRIDEIHAANLAHIKAGNDPDLTLYELPGSMFARALDLSKWTYPQFYPISAAELLERQT